MLRGMGNMLRSSLEKAEAVLTEDGQAELALLVDTFTRSHEGIADRQFSAAELDEIRAFAKQPFRPASEQDVAAFFSDNDTQD